MRHDPLEDRSYIEARAQFEICRRDPGLYAADGALLNGGDGAAGLRMADAQLYASYYRDDDITSLPMALYSDEEQQQIQFAALMAEAPGAAAGMGVIAFRIGKTLPFAAKSGTTYMVSYDTTGQPDFSPWAIATVKINMKGNTTTDFTAANKAAGLKTTPPGYTWHHHEDGTTMQLVPTELNNGIFHYGGRYTIKNGGSLDLIRLGGLNLIRFSGQVDKRQ